MVINTSRFGQIKLEQDDVVTFPEGLLGFNEKRKFVFVDDPTDEIFAWLQSCEDPALAFPVLEPELFADTKSFTLAKSDFEALGLADLTRARFYCIVTIPDDPQLMTANMKAPVVINLAKKTARQCVLQDNSLAIREPIFGKLQQRLISQPQQSLKPKLIESGPAMAVPINKAADQEL